ncbi:hypothetical protein ACOJVU_10190 [Mycobacterium sp. THU-M104]|uniref:hypothetical protein n=1 Tax=Mycobacterium sp. THU-M104 TaxID=3410515 RepID=UPI003B9C0C19
MSDLVLVDGEDGAMVGAGDLAVVGVGAGSAALLLPVPLLDLFVETDAVPAGGASLASIFRAGGVRGC